MPKPKRTSKPQKDLLSEFQAAVLIGMSPELLRWLTTYAPKQGSTRKLPIAATRNNTLFFEKKELLDFNEWLRQPWPHKKGSRPHIPEGIRDEIKREANGECAMCKTNRDSCQAAHLDPVSKSKNNHPENLLWLCANHHIPYDKGLYCGPLKEDEQFVAGYKTSLHRYQKRLWETQAEGSRRAFLILEECNRLSEQLSAAKTKTQVDALTDLAVKTINEIPNLQAATTTDPKHDAYLALTTSTNFDVLKKGNATANNVSEKLKTAVAARTKYVADLGLVECPLCEGAGSHNGYDCPACGGDGEVEKSFVSEISLSEYKTVECPLCDGKGSYEDYDECPRCGGDGELEKRFADQINVDDYKKIECPLCEGDGSYEDYDECPECKGLGKVERQYARDINLSDYKMIECPLCKGEGSWGDFECPECAGKGKMEKGRANQVELSQYKKVECPKCNGSGEYRDDNCPKCDGTGKVERRFTYD